MNTNVLNVIGPAQFGTPCQTTANVHVIAVRIWKGQ